MWRNRKALIQMAPSAADAGGTDNLMPHQFKAPPSPPGLDEGLKEAIASTDGGCVQGESLARAFDAVRPTEEPVEVYLVPDKAPDASGDSVDLPCPTLATTQAVNFLGACEGDPTKFVVRTRVLIDAVACGAPPESAAVVVPAGPYRVTGREESPAGGEVVYLEGAADSSGPESR